MISRACRNPVIEKGHDGLEWLSALEAVLSVFGYINMAA